ncbi:hypothetical protein ACH4L5_05160 [Streptomyces sp. NPDC017405]|uniref:hypothetical protein n=1 Tax=unclassified Streptomyces TaxID=2593676 RepID=UPI0037A1589D
MSHNSPVGLWRARSAVLSVETRRQQLSRVSGEGPCLRLLLDLVSARISQPAAHTRTGTSLLPSAQGRRAATEDEAVATPTRAVAVWRLL